MSKHGKRYFNALKKAPKKEAGLAKGSGVPNKNKVGKVTKAQLLKIVEIKKADLNTEDPEQAIKMIEGTARNMGIEVVE